MILLDNKILFSNFPSDIIYKIYHFVITENMNSIDDPVYTKIENIFLSYKFPSKLSLTLSEIIINDNNSDIDSKIKTISSKQFILVINRNNNILYCNLLKQIVDQSHCNVDINHQSIQKSILTEIYSTISDYYKVFTFFFNF